MSLSKSKSILTGVLLAILLAVTATASAFDGFRLWAPYQPESFGGARRSNNGVYGSLEGIYWKVERPKNIPSQVDSIIADTIDTNFGLGTRLTVGNRSGHHGWLFSGYGISGLGGSYSSTGKKWDGMEKNFDVTLVSFDYDRSSGISGNEVHYTPNITIIPVPEHYYRILDPIITLSTKTNISNLELSYSYRTHPFKWGDMELYAGARFWGFDDRLSIQDGTNFTFFRYREMINASDLGDNFSLSDLDTDSDVYALLVLHQTAQMSKRANNRVIGPQIGFQVSRRNQRWTFGAEGHLMAGINNQSFDYFKSTDVSFANGDTTTNNNNNNSNNTSTIANSDITKEQIAILGAYKESIAAQPTIKHHENKTVFSPAIELQLFTKWQLTDAAGIKLGFNSTIVDKVARGSDILTSTDPDGNMLFNIRSGGATVITYGFNFGIEIKR